MAVAARISIDAEVSYLHSRIDEEKLILEMLEDEAGSAISRKDIASRQLEDIRNALVRYGVDVPSAEELDAYFKREEHEVPQSPNSPSPAPLTPSFDEMVLHALNGENLDDASVLSGFSPASLSPAASIRQLSPPSTPPFPPHHALTPPDLSPGSRRSSFPGTSPVSSPVTPPSRSCSPAHAGASYVDKSNTTMRPFTEVRVSLPNEDGGSGAGSLMG